MAHVMDISEKLSAKNTWSLTKYNAIEKSSTMCITVLSACDTFIHIGPGYCSGINNTNNDC